MAHALLRAASPLMGTLAGLIVQPKRTNARGVSMSGDTARKSACATSSSKLNLLHVNLLRIELSQAEHSGDLDVFHLAIQKVAIFIGLR